MTLRRRLYIAAAVLVIVLAVAGVLLVRSVEATEIGETDQQLTSLLATPTLPLFVDRTVLSAGAPVGIRVQFGRPAANSGSPVGNSGAPIGNSGGPLSAAAKQPTGAELHIPKQQRVTFVGDFYVATLTGGKRQLVAKPLGASRASPQTPTASSGPLALSLHFVTVGSLSGSGLWRAVLIRVSNSQAELVAVSLNPADATITRVRFAVLGAGLLALIALVAAGLWVSRLGLRPIAEVAEVADRITAGDRSRRVTSVRPGTEAEHLATAFNVMLDDQQATEARLRQLVADASHELRTPLSVIQGFAGLWRQGELREGHSADDAMRRIGQESARMAKLVEDLLLLAHLDEGRPLEKKRVDLVALIGSVIVDIATTHPSRTITFDVEGPATVLGDEAALRRVAFNLLSNAVTHTPPTATVAVEVAENAERVVLAVHDSGPGMDEESVAHAFDRFWRGDTSRSRPGNGLGLPIVAGILADSGGEVSLVSAPESGSTVRVVLLSGVPRHHSPRPDGRPEHEPANDH